MPLIYYLAIKVIIIVYINSYASIYFKISLKSPLGTTVANPPCRNINLKKLWP